MYHPYVDSDYYLSVDNGTHLDCSNIDKYLRQASRDIDVLTFHRISDKGFDKLTEHQQEIIKEVCCEHASFLIDNEPMLKTYLSGYSINGVSMNFVDLNNVYMSQGVVMDKSLYRRLCATGLCCRSCFYYG